MTPVPQRCPRLAARLPPCHDVLRLPPPGGRTHAPCPDSLTILSDTPQIPLSVIFRFSHPFESPQSLEGDRGRLLIPVPTDGTRRGFARGAAPHPSGVLRVAPCRPPAGQPHGPFLRPPPRARGDFCVSRTQSWGGGGPHLPLPQSPPFPPLESLTLVPAPGGSVRGPPPAALFDTAAHGLRAGPDNR